MSDMPKDSNNTKELRRKAEEKVASQPVSTGETDVKRLLHELQVHQVELEIQNEELRQANAEITEQKEYLNNIIKETPAGYFRLDFDGRFLDVNDAWLHMHGYDSADEVVGKHFSMMQIDDSSDSALAHLAELQKGVPIPYGEYRSRRKDGSVGHHVFSAHPLLDTGRVVRFEWFIIDITERKQAEDALRESEENYRSLNRAMLQPLALHEIICDDSGSPIDYRYLDVNPAFETLLGKSASEIIGKTVLELLPNIKAHWIETYGKVALEGKSIQFEQYAQPLDRYFDVVAYSPRPGRFAVIANDVTDRKQVAEEQIKMEKLKSVGILAGGIAHDFNNVLTSLYGNLSLVKMKLANDHPGFRFLEAAEQSMLKATLLTNRLLTFAKGGDPVKKSLSLISLIEEVVNLSLSGSNVKPVITSPANPWPASVDHRQIEQVFASLTLNAREAMPDGGLLTITIENAELAYDAEQGLSGGQYLRITMADEGTGIDPELMDKIFDPYFTTKEMGSGLGLSTAYSIINKHGGYISVTSQLGKGTTFTIYLPATGVAQPPLELTKPASASQDKTFKILVMDDEAMICNMIKDLLGELGYAVETAVDGKQAIEKYRQARDDSHPFDVVILDLTVPGGMGGKEAAKGILQIDPEAKMIVSSGYADDPIVANYTDHGFKGVASKPYSLKKLSGVLDQVIEKG